MRLTKELHHEKIRFFVMRKHVQISCAVTAQVISAFVFTTLIVQFLLCLYPNFQDSSFTKCVIFSVPVEMDVFKKTLLLGSTFLIDFVYFERNKN